MEVGCPDHLLGRDYLEWCIDSAVENPCILQQITKRLYPECAWAFNTTASRAERAIRHAIEVITERCDYQLYSEVFGSSISAKKGNPTNSEFISRAANIIRRRNKS